MYWFTRPPYLRYAAAAAIVATALWLDLRPTSHETRPFAAADLPAGIEVTEADIDWRGVPVGVLEPVVPEGLITRPVGRGEPLRTSDFAVDVESKPDGWWSMQAILPDGVETGQELRLVVLPDHGIPPPDPIPAVVVNPPPAADGLLAAERHGQIAVPPDLAATAAAAIAEDRVTVLIGSMR